MEKFTVNFQGVTDKHFLGITKRGSDGFVSAGISVIKKKILLELASNEVSSEENLSLISYKQLLKKQLLKKRPLKNHRSLLKKR